MGKASLARVPVMEPSSRSSCFFIGRRVSSSCVDGVLPLSYQIAKGRAIPFAKKSSRQRHGAGVDAARSVNFRFLPYSSRTRA